MYLRGDTGFTCICCTVDEKEPKGRDGTRKMAQVGTIQVPAVRWGGRWMTELSHLDDCEEWQELTGYKPTTAYQVARALNLGRALPVPPEGRQFEFGSRLEIDGTSTLLVRCVEV